MNTELNSLKRILERERKARKESERILEEKSLELFHANQELKRLYDSLEHKYQRIIEQAEDIIFRGDEKGRCIYVNNVVTKILGYSKEELIGKHFTEFVTNDQIKKIYAFYEQQFRTQQENTYLEFTVYTKHGELVWLGQNVSLLIEDGKVIGTSAVARDISSQKQAEELVRLNEKKYRSIIDNMELGLLEVDTEGLVVSANSRFSEITGYKESELLGKDPAIILTDQMSRVVIQQKNEDRKLGKSSVYEVKCKRKNGRSIWLMISGAPRYNKANQFIGSIGIHMDITEQKNVLDELKKAKSIAEDSSKAKDTFLAHMSHEIRTPLNSVLGMISLLQDTKPTHEQKEFLEAIKFSSEILLNIINDILDFSKIEAGKIELNEQVFDVVELVNALYKTFSYRLKDKQVKFQLEIDPSINTQFIGDKTLVNQILMNLISNATKFTAEGYVKLGVNKLLEDQNKIYLGFTVEDSGIGIHPRKVDQVFDSFKQLNSEGDKNYGGTGLGLTIVKHLVSLLGGEIDLESKVNVGSKFTVKIPFQSTQLRILPNRIKRIPIDHSVLKGRRVLVAEDNLMNQKLLSKVLDKLHLSYQITEDGKKCLEMAEKESFDLILMDVQMPILDGYETSKRIRKLPNSNKNIPIIGLTASALVNEKNKVLQAGMNSYLPKPYSPEELIECMAKYMNESKLNQTKKVGLDRSYIDEFYGNDKDFKVEMLKIFLKNLGAEMDQLQKASEQNEHQKVKAIAHKNKSSFTMAGFGNSLAKELEIIERLAHKEDLNYKTLVDKLIALIPDLTETVQEELSKSQLI